MVSPMMEPNLQALRYRCFLDEQPDYLIPPRLFAPTPAGSLIVNPHCWFSWSGEMPAHLAASIGDTGGVFDSNLVWVLDAATGAVWPYAVGEDYIRYLGMLAPGMAVPRDFPPLLTWVLTNAGVLVPPDHAARRRWDWAHSAALSSKNFRHGYTFLPPLIPPLHVGALRRYFRYRIRTGGLPFGDDQVARRYASHNEPVARYLQGQLTEVVRQVLHRRVKPTYAYVAAYLGGSVLEPHTDREQCEYTITLCVDATPEPAGACPWPINLDTPKGRLQIFQELGGALLFRGREIPHYRDRLANGSTSTSLLFHYVDDSFSGGLD
jgi:hypothetical protein